MANFEQPHQQFSTIGNSGIINFYNFKCRIHLYKMFLSIISVATHKHRLTHPSLLPHLLKCVCVFQNKSPDWGLRPLLSTAGSVICSASISTTHSSLPSILHRKLHFPPTCQKLRCVCVRVCPRTCSPVCICLLGRACAYVCVRARETAKCVFTVCDRRGGCAEGGSE